MTAYAFTVSSEIVYGETASHDTDVVVTTAGTPPYSYAVTSGSLPAGITFTSGGAFRGTPTSAAPGPYTVTITGTDSTTPTPQTCAVTVAVWVNQLPGITQAKDRLGRVIYTPNAQGTGTVMANGSPALGTTTGPGFAFELAGLPPAGRVSGVAVQVAQVTFTAGQGAELLLVSRFCVPPVTYTLAGELPPGLRWSPDGSIVGVPTCRGRWRCTVHAADSATPYPNGDAADYLFVVV